MLFRSLLSHRHLEEAAHLPVWVVLLSHLHLEEAAHLPVWVVLLSHLHFEALEWALEVPHLLLLGLLPKADSCSSCLGLVVVMNRVTHKKRGDTTTKALRYGRSTVPVATCRDLLTGTKMPPLLYSMYLALMIKTRGYIDSCISLMQIPIHKS